MPKHCRRGRGRDRRPSLASIRPIHRVRLLALALTAIACEQPGPSQSPCSIGGGEVPRWSSAAPVTPTAAALDARFPSGRPPAVTWIVPERGLSTTGNYVVPRDGEVVLRGLATSNRSASSFRFVATALVDLQPVASTWRIAGRPQKQAKGVSFVGARREYEFEVRIPVPVDGRAHEIETYVEIAPARSRDSGDADVRRFIAGAPGSSLPPRRCVPASPSSWLERDGTLRREGFTASLAHYRPREVEAAIEPHSGSAGVALLVDGVPHPRTIAIKPPDGESPPADVMHRQTWTLQEPPRHHAVVVIWRDAFHTDPASTWTSNFASSNAHAP